MSIDEPESANDQQPPDDEQREGADLERYGRFRVNRRRSPLEIDSGEVLHGSRPGSRRVRRPRERPFQRLEEGGYLATEAATRGRTRGERIWRGFKRVLVGAPLATSESEEQKIPKTKALAVFSSDALSSSAYATDEILLVLVAAGTGALTHSIEIAIAIAALLAIVTFSYRQTIRAYPNGGGAYIVARENLGDRPGIAAAAALSVDYILTVSVSMAAGVFAITSAFQDLHEFRIEIAVGLVALVTLANLRGIRDSSTIFAIPTYAFIVAFSALLIGGFVRLLLDPNLTAPVEPSAVETGGSALTVFLVLRAFSSGSAALTGVEAISNGVPAFKRPESRNAATTLLAMAAILAIFFLGLTVLAHELDVRHAHDISVPAQVARAVFGTSPVFYLIQGATALILILAANTAYADFPRLGSILAKDKFLPHQFTFRGDRLAFSNGIIVLGLASAILLVVFRADVDELIPLYAFGVFVSFTLSQGGMVVHWLRLREPGWKRSIAVNGVGAIATGVVAVIVGATKFVDGAWLSMLMMGILAFAFTRVHHHYRRVEEQLEVTELPPPTPPTTDRYRERAVLVPVDELNQAVLHTVEYARTISDNVTAVHVTDELEAGKRLREAWERTLPLTPLEIIVSPQRSFIVPMLRYVDAIDRVDPAAYITVVIPEYVPAHFWEGLLHNQSAGRLKKELMRRPHTVVIDVPYHLEP